MRCFSALTSFSSSPGSAACMTSNRDSRVSLRQRCALVAASPWDSTSSRLPMRSVRADRASRLKLLAPPQLVVLRWPPRPPCRTLPGA